MKEPESIKETLLYYINNPQEASWNFGVLKNALCRSELWYDPFYALSKTFTVEELNNMSDEMIEACYKTAEAIGGALY